MASDRSTSTTILATNYLKPRKDAYINKTEAIKNAHPSPFLFLKCKKKHSFTSSHLGSNFQHHLGTHNKTFIDLEISTSLKPNVTGQKEIKKSTPHSPHPKSSTCHRPGNAAVRNALSSRPKKYASFTSLAIAPFKSKTSPNSLHSANHAEIFDPLKNKITYPDLSKKSCSPNKISNSISEETLKLGNNFSLSLHPVKSTGIIPKSTSPLSLESKNHPKSKKLRIFRISRLPVSPIRNKIRVVLPLHFLITKRFKLKPEIINRPLEGDEGRTRTGSAETETQTKESAILDSSFRTSFLQQHNISAPLTKKNVINLNKSILENKSIRNFNPDPFLLSSISFPNTPSSDSLEIHKVSPKLKASRLATSLNYFFEESHFAKSSKDAWEKQKSSQSIYSKYLNEKCKRVIESAQIKSPKSRLSTFMPPISTNSSSYKSRAASAPARTILIQSPKTTFNRPLTPTFKRPVEKSQVFMYFTKPKTSILRSNYKKRKHPFKGPHHFELIPQQLYSSNQGKDLNSITFSKPSESLKQVILDFFPERNKVDYVKYQPKKILFQKQKIHSPTSPAHYICPFVQLPKNIPISFPSTTSQIYYVSKNKIKPLQKIIPSGESKVPFVPRRLTLTAFFPLNSSAFKLKKEKKRKSVAHQENNSINLDLPLPMTEEIVQIEVSKDDVLHTSKNEDLEKEAIELANNVTEAFVPKVNSFSAGQRVMFVQDFTILSKWHEDVTAKNFVNNNMYSLEVDTRKITEFNEEDFRTMVWNLYFYVIRIGHDILIFKGYFNQIYEIMLSNNQESEKIKNCRSVLESIPKRMHLSLKSVFGHSFRLSKVATNNAVFLGILYAIIGHVLFPGIRLPSPPSSPKTSINTLIHTTSTSKRRSKISFSSDTKFSERLSKSSFHNSSLIKSDTLDTNNYNLNEMDVLEITMREPIDIELEETRLHDIKAVMSRVVAGVIRGEPLTLQLPPEGLTFMYLVERFEDLF